MLFTNLSNIALIDVRRNNIPRFELDLLSKIKTGLQLFISGKYELII